MGKRIALSALLAIIMVFTFKTLAETVYEDSFDGSLKWVEITQTSTSKDNSSGKLHVNNSKQSLAILKHDDANINSLTEFTYSVDIEKSNNEVSSSGIFFCFNISNSGIGGYQFYIKEDGVLGFVKWEGSSPTNMNLGDGKTSFRDKEKVKLTVSKNGNDMYFFCDDEFVGTINDASFPSGEICLTVGSGEELYFDNVLVTNQSVTGSPRTGFVDDFSSIDLRKGWQVYYGGGSYSKEDGSITISDDIQLWTTGDYDAVACTMVVSYASGDSMGFYGINLIGLNEKPSRTFVINAKRYFGVYSGTGKAGQNSNITGTDDTIIVTEDHHLIVNGAVLDDTTFTTGDQFRGVALYAAAGVTASVKSIKIGNDTSIPISHNNLKFNNNSKEYEIGGTGIIYDIRGRKVAQFEQSDYQNKLQSLGTGQFFVISKNKQHSIKRAIINVK